MQIKVVIVSALTVALLGVGMLAGSVFGASHAFAQAAVAPVGQTAAAPAGQAIAAPVGQTAAATPVPAAPAAPAAPKAAPRATPDASQAKITQQQAEAAALTANPGTTVDHTQLQNQNGTLVYDVDFANGGGVIVDATTGAIIKTEAAGTDGGGRGGHGGPGGADQAALLAQAKITQAQAEAAALAVNAGATVDHSRLGDDNGTVFWDVDFTNGGGAKVDATTGAVIASEAAGTDHVGGGRPGGHGGKGGLPATQPTQP